MKFLRFNSEQAMLDALQPYLYDGRVPSYIDAVAVDVVGVVREPTGRAVETEVGPIPEFAPIPGWHVNLSAGIPALEQFEIPAPSNPSRVFAAEPEPVRVPHEVSMGQCRLALFDLHEIKTDEEFYALADILPEEMRPRALLELRTRTTVEYGNPLGIAFCEAKGWNRDELFTYAAGL